MLDAFASALPERLGLPDYGADFERHFWKTGAPGFWKLERQQVFKEPFEPSWAAFAAGDWEGAMRLIRGKREDFGQYYQRIADQGFINRRVRIVEKPLTPYLQWELHVLALRHEFGGLTSVVEASQVTAFETRRPLPEIYTLGTEVMYEALYDRNGVLEAAHRFTDHALIIECQQFIQSLYESGEPLDRFMAREVTHLDPPARQ